MATFEELQTQLTEINEQCIDITTSAEAEKRDLTDEERDKRDELMSQYDKIKEERDARKRLEEQTASLKEADDKEERDARNRRTTEAGETKQRIAWKKDREKDDPNWGYRSFGHFCYDVAVERRTHKASDAMLRAASTYGSEAVGVDGGFAVPPGMAATILAELEDETSLLARASSDTIQSNSMTYPKDEATPWGTAGIIAAWEGEAATHTDRKPKLETTTIKANKLVSQVEVTDELLEDANALNGYVSRKAASAIRFKTDLALNQGSGSGEPLGFRDAPGTIAVARNATNINATDIRNMWVRLYGPWRKNAVWLANQDTEVHLMQMYGIDQETTPLTTWPVYLPQGGYSASPFSTLMGRPVVFTQTCDAVTNKGDIAVVDMSQYRAVQKGGIRANSSIHLHFDQDITTFKFVMRIGGQPMWASAISPRSGSVTMSGFVVLAA